MKKIPKRDGGDVVSDSMLSTGAKGCAIPGICPGGVRVGHGIASGMPLSHFGVAGAFRKAE
jgi:hypothetical protein